MNAIGKINSVADLLSVCKDAGFQGQEHAHVRQWFRGHSRAGWQLAPGVYRPNFNVSDEGQRRLKESHLAQDFRILSAGVRAGQETHEELYFLQQHYRMPTRLLDWSNSALAALYFAVDDSSPESDTHDGEVFMMDAYELLRTQGAKYSNGNDFMGIATSSNSAFKEAVALIRDWNFKAEFPDFIIPVRPEHHDRRMSLQRSCFTFHVPTRPALTERENPTVRRFTIPSGSKLTIRQELTLLGVDAFAIFGDMDRLADTLKSAYNAR